MSSERVAYGLFAACLFVLFVAAPGEAIAQTKYKVRITSTPSGATVYINSRETEPVGKTPLTHRLPSGNHTLILELADHEQLVDSIYVKKKRWKRQSFKMKLSEIEYGFVAISASKSSSEGASILVDGKKSGIVPRTIKVPPGAHQIEIVKDGYQRFEKWMEITAGKKTSLSVKLKADGETDPDPTDPEPKTKIKKSGPSSAPGATEFVSASAGFELGWRKLRYRNAQTTNLVPFDADHVGMLSVNARLHPMARGKSASMRRLALTGQVALAAPLETSTMTGTEAIETTWREFDVGVSYGVPVNDSVTLGLDVAYGATQFAFSNAGTLADSVPEVDYRYVRLAAEMVYRGEKLRAGIGAAWLPILSTGVMVDRFARAASAGLKVGAGVSHAITKNLAGEFSAFYRRYAHNFSYDAGATFQADGADDHFFGLTLGLTLRAF